MRPEQITVEKITPEMAREYLVHNNDNRTLRKARFEAYGTMMKRGQWLITGDPIRFDTEGRLIDGQHRLHGVIYADMPIEFIVLRDVPAEAYQVIDAGLARSVGDALGSDVSDRTTRAAVSRILYVVEAGGDPRLREDMRQVSRVDAAEYHQANQGRISAAIPVARPLYTAFSGGNLTAWTGFTCLAWGAVGETSDLAGQFVNGVRTGADLGAGDPRLALRNFLGNNRPLPNAGHHLHLLLKTWNAWLRGDQRQIVTSRADEPWPVMLAERVTRNGHVVSNDDDIDAQIEALEREAASG